MFFDLNPKTHITFDIMIPNNERNYKDAWGHEVYDAEYMSMTLRLFHLEAFSCF